MLLADYVLSHGGRACGVGADLANRRFRRRRRAAAPSETPPPRTQSLPIVVVITGGCPIAGIPVRVASVFVCRVIAIRSVVVLYVSYSRGRCRFECARAREHGRSSRV